MVKDIEKMDIIQMKREGHSLLEISRKTGRSRNTIRKILLKTEPRPRKPRETKLDEHRVTIAKRLLDGAPPVRILADLKLAGVSVSRAQFYRLVAVLDGDRKRAEKITVRYETDPGQQAQMDWGEFGEFTIGGVKMKLYGFFVLLSWSRFHHAEFTTSMKSDVFLACHQRAFESFGGVPRNILYDNMKQVRIGPEKLNPLLVDFALHHGFAIKTCRPYRPQTKGKIERLIGYFRKNCHLPRVFDSLADANAAMAAWCLEANARVHGTTKEVPVERLRKELDRLTPWATIRAWSGHAVTRKADNEAMVNFGGSRYSVPMAQAGLEVELQMEGAVIKISLGGVIVASHKQAHCKGMEVHDPAHVSAKWKFTDDRSAKKPPANVAALLPVEVIEDRSLLVYAELDGKVQSILLQSLEAVIA